MENVSNYLQLIITLNGFSARLPQPTTSTSSRAREIKAKVLVSGDAADLQQISGGKLKTWAYITHSPCLEFPYLPPLPDLFLQNDKNLPRHSSGKSHLL